MIKKKILIEALLFERPIQELFDTEMSSNASPSRNSRKNITHSLTSVSPAQIEMCNYIGVYTPFLASH